MTAQQEGFCRPPPATPERAEDKTHLVISMIPPTLWVTLKSHLIFRDMGLLATERTGDNGRRGLPWKPVEEDWDDSCDDGDLKSHTKTEHSRKSSWSTTGHTSSDCRMQSAWRELTQTPAEPHQVHLERWCFTSGGVKPPLGPVWGPCCPKQRALEDCTFLLKVFHEMSLAWPVCQQQPARLGRLVQVASGHSSLAHASPYQPASRASWWPGDAVVSPPCCRGATQSQNHFTDPLQGSLGSCGPELVSLLQHKEEKLRTRF